MHNLRIEELCEMQRSSECRTDTGIRWLRFSIPWAQAAALWDKCAVSPEMGITVPLPYSRTILWRPLERVLFNDAVVTVTYWLSLYLGNFLLASPHMVFSLKYTEAANITTRYWVVLISFSPGGKALCYKVHLPKSRLVLNTALGKGFSPKRRGTK